MDKTVSEQLPEFFVEGCTVRVRVDSAFGPGDIMYCRMGDWYADEAQRVADALNNASRTSPEPGEWQVEAACNSGDEWADMLAQRQMADIAAEGEAAGMERAAKALYEEDDAWSAAFPWPHLKEGEKAADNYRRLAAAALRAASIPTQPGVEVKPVGYVSQKGLDYLMSGQINGAASVEPVKTRTATIPLYASPAPLPVGVASEWQPMDTAPKDGSRVLCWHPGWLAPESGCLYGMFWASNGYAADHGGWKYQPTHWRPLPPPPAALTKDHPHD